MSDRFRPLSMEQLSDWVFDELEGQGSVFGIPRAAFFVPGEADRFRSVLRGQPLETPFGVAAGPHTQLAQNIVVAWLCGARVIELKTVQTLDELAVHKPCIDVQDEGYNVEWSQELRVHESFDEYLRAWVLIHALHDRLGFPGGRPGVVFDMSVGYDLAGIGRPNMQWYLDAMADASGYLPTLIDVVARRHPAVRDLAIPARITESVTLSTMHGCPPDEIERIASYLIVERGLHTQVKCNPTLLGADEVRGIVNDDLGYRDVPIPDEAFGHDLAWADAVPMFERLREVADEHGRTFGLKLSNTLEVRNWRTRFEGEPTMYLSGRALHAVTASLAARVDEAFDGGLPISFAGGADCFNAADLLAAGIQSVTVCSDLLKTGGYLRLPQYVEELERSMDASGATDLPDLVTRSAVAGERSLRRYADRTRRDWRYQKGSFRTDHSKTPRALGRFDCIAAPCVDECPVDQKVPQYMEAVRRGDMAEAVRLTRQDNPLACILARVCDHHCEDTCVRTHLDQPLAIRHVKRFIMEHGAETVVPAPEPGREPAHGLRVAIVGAGPAGLAAARELAAAGAEVRIVEAHDYPGGMVGGAIPAYRLPQAAIDADVAVVERLGVGIRYGQVVGRDVTLDGLRAEGFETVLVAVGAQRARRLGLEGEDAAGVIDALGFLRGVREGTPLPVGPRVGIVGAGDTAMDAARTAKRVGAREVSLIYRRRLEDMPADREEIAACREEGIGVVELARPMALHVEHGRLAGLVCARTELGDERDASGRRVARDVPGSTFELPLDTLLVAISQHPVLDLFGAQLPVLTPAGAIDVDPTTFASSIAGVHAIGDVAADGPASIVKAAADGKAAAAAILAAHGGTVREPTREPDPAPAHESAPVPAHVDVQAMVVRRARRHYRVPIESVAPEARAGFEPTVLGYTAEQATAEASRCLDCQVMCSLCVGVCPNLAIVTYRSEPFVADLPTLLVDAGGVRAGARQPHRVRQGLQVAVLADLCNECGSCTTVCPTAGDPYRDKPRLYLDATDFEAETDNAFRLLADGSIEARWHGQTHRLADDGVVTYDSPALRARLDATTLEPLEVAPGPATAADASVSLEPAAEMLVLLRGLRRSMPHLPRAAAG